MTSVHQRGQVPRAGLIGDGLEQRTRVAAVVDDAQHLHVPAQEVRKRRVVERPDMTRSDALERAIEPGRIGGKLVHAFQTAIEAVLLAQRRLGGGAQHGADAIVARQLLQQLHARAQQMQRQGLRLVQDHHAARDVVQLPALRGPIREQALEELHSRGNDDGRIPVLHRQPALLFRLQLGLGVLEERAMVLEDRVLAEVAEGLAEDAGGLLDDAGERNHIDHAAQPMRNRVIERPCQRGERLAAAGRDGQREQAGQPRRAAAYVSENLGAQRIDALVSGKAGQMKIEPFAQRGQCRARPFRTRLAPLENTVVVVGVDEIGIDQAREDHPRQQRELERTAFA
ncbi:MAG: hypothetical protein NVV68_06425 [Dokdonella sp.]|nr:hypothetical protein [Dokdonella sp.]